MWCSEVYVDVRGNWRTYTVEGFWICTLLSHNVRNFLNLTHNENKKSRKDTQTQRCKAVAVHALVYRSEISTPPPKKKEAKIETAEIKF
jgi:hypothetical protein